MISRARFFEAEGLRLRVHVCGRGEPLLLLHGFTGSGRGLVELSERLAAHYRVIAPDLPGHGETLAPDDPAAYAMERCGAALAALVASQRAGCAHVLGYSMGGRVALALCAWHPDRLRSAVVVGASAGLEHEDERRARRAADEALADTILREGSAAFADRWARHPLFATQRRRLSPERRSALASERSAQRPGGLALSLRGMGTGAQPPLHEPLAASPVPLLFLAGADDAKFRAIAEDLRHRLPGADADVVPDAGHAAHLENPDAVTRLARRHFTRHGGRAAAATTQPQPTESIA